MDTTNEIVANENQKVTATIEKEFSIFNAGQFMAMKQLADVMASALCTVPKHLAGNNGDCFAVAMQAIQWEMNPFAVAQKTHLVNGVLGYEAQLIGAVVNTRAPLLDRLHFEWFGDWDKIVGKFETRSAKNGGTYQAPAWNVNDEIGLGVKVWATIRGENEPRELVLLLSQATVRNSTLWASDPKQQIAYLAEKRWARLHCPEVILGVYTPDELEEVARTEMKDITPETAPQETGIKGLKSKLMFEKKEKLVDIEAVKPDLPLPSEVASKYILENNAPATVKMLEDYLKSKKVLPFGASLDMRSAWQAKWLDYFLANIGTVIRKAVEWHEAQVAEKE